MRMKTLKTKLVYVLTSNGKDEFSAMLLMSLYSLHLYHKKDVVEIVMDWTTYIGLKEVNSSILEMGEVNVVDIPEGLDVMQRSRYLKTNLRRIVKGDYLYIDSDTIICCPLEDLDDLNYDLGMVADQNNSVPQTDQGQLELNKKAGFDAYGEPYYNGGVSLVRDTPNAYTFFDLWKKMWHVSMANGVSKDQPALCETNKQLGHPITEMDGVWNWQLLNNYLYYLPKAKILHYWNIYEWKKLFVARTNKSQRIDKLTALWLRHPRFAALLLYLKRLVKN